MDFDAIFQAYYSLFRADSDVPTSADDEYTVGLRLANEAVNRWRVYDNTYWKELFATSQDNSTGGVVTITTGTKTYAAPTAFAEAGGFVRILDGNGNVVDRYPIIEPHEKQFRTDQSKFAYFTGNNAVGFTLNLNPAPTSATNGFSILYDYYKKPTEFTTGTDVTEMADPYFIVHRMLAQQFRAARNPYYSSAKQDAEDSLRQMQLINNSGTWANPWTIADTSGNTWGA